MRSSIFQRSGLRAVVRSVLFTALVLVVVSRLDTLLSNAYAAVAQGDTRSAESEQIKFRWATRAEDVDVLVGALKAAHATVNSTTEPFKPQPEELSDYSDPAFAPLAVIVGVAGLSILAEEIVHLYRGIKHSGVIVDVRGKEVVIRENPAIPYGMVLVVGEKGTVKFEPQSTIDSTAIIQAVIGVRAPPR